MNIIFGDSIKLIPDRFTVLELDTIRATADSEPVTAYCVIEKIPLHEFPLIDAHRQLHNDIIKYYREREWDYCEQAIETLIGKWAGELDSFYSALQTRVRQYRENPPDSTWDGTYIKSKTESIAD